MGIQGSWQVPINGLPPPNGLQGVKCAIQLHALLAQDRFGWPAGYVQLACDVVIIAAALTVASPAVVAASALGAGLLNLVLVMNHRPGRYLGASLGRRGS